MEIVELADLRKAFMPSEKRYLNPHAEAMRLRTLWTYVQRPNRSRDVKRLIKIYAEAKKFVEMKDFAESFRLINLGLLINPRFHSLYALRADIFSQQGNLNGAIQNYEEARKMVKFDKNMKNGKSLYTRNLIDIYCKSGLQNFENGRLLEALSDYEQVLILRPYGVIVNEIQDQLLKTLRILDKYDAFRCDWTHFMNDADPSRASELLTQHAEFKMHRNEMDSARHILFEAIDLDTENSRAHELLQVVYDTGHHLVAFSIIWAVSGCYDKALLTIEKGRDCDPYNPGYTLLKVIMLRLSGRLLEATKWLESVDKGFHKLLQPSRDKQGSIMGNLTMEQTRIQLIRQWYLIRYEIAVRFMLEERYEDAVRILQSIKLQEEYSETYLLLGDCMLKLGNTDEALGVYLKYLKKIAAKNGDVQKEKSVFLLKRITDILNDKCNEAVEDGRTTDAIEIADKVVKMLDDEYSKDSTKLGHNRGEALIIKARALYQKNEITKNNICAFTTAEGLKLTRGVDDFGLYRTIFNNEKLEKVVDHFGTRRKLPASLKLLMQYS